MGAKKYLEALKEKEEEKTLYIRCGETLFDSVKKYCKKNEISQTAFVTSAIEFFIENLEAEEKKKRKQSKK